MIHRQQFPHEREVDIASLAFTAAGFVLIVVTGSKWFWLLVGVGAVTGLYSAVMFYRTRRADKAWRDFCKINSTDPRCDPPTTHYGAAEGTCGTCGSRVPLVHGVVGDHDDPGQTASPGRRCSGYLTKPLEAP